jgi:NTE family protein
MGDGAATSITRFVRQGHDGEPSSRDYDFSDIAIRANQEQGYALARETLRKAAEGSAEAGMTIADRPSPSPHSLPSIGESDRLASDAPPRRRAAKAKPDL